MESKNKQFGFLILIIIVFSVFIACTSRLEEVTPSPPDLIPKDVMVDIIVDLHLMDAVLQSSQKRGEKGIESKKYFLYKSILEKYGISRQQFESSMEYYQKDLKIVDAIYADVIIKLTKIKSEVETKN